MISGVSTLFTYNALVLLVFILGWSFYAFRKKNYSLLEIGWPLSLVFVVWTSFLLFGAQSIYRRLLVLTVTIWGLRLAFHLYTLYWNQPESSRYQRLRQAWEGKLSGLKAVIVLVIAPLLVYYVVSMILSIGFLDSQETLSWWQYVGVALWALGMLFEIGSEVQLKKFLSKPENEGQMLTKGLWRISRHPHYFGTAIVWWGIYFISIVDWNNLLGILSPIMMTLFAIYLASRSSSELKYQERDELQDYTRKTSQFLPFSAQIGRALSSLGRGLGRGVSKMTKASAGAVSSAAKKAKDSRKKDETTLEDGTSQLTDSELGEEAAASTTTTAAATLSSNFASDTTSEADASEQDWFKEEIPTEELASVTESELSLDDETTVTYETELADTKVSGELSEDESLSDQTGVRASYELEEDRMATEDDDLFEAILADEDTLGDDTTDTTEASVAADLSIEETAIPTEAINGELVDALTPVDDSLETAKEEVSEEIVADMLEAESEADGNDDLQKNSYN